MVDWKDLNVRLSKERSEYSPKTSIVSYTLQIFQAEHLFLVKAIFGKHYGHDALKSTSLQYVVCIWLP